MKSVKVPPPDRLTGSNYSDWAFQTTFYLQLAGLLKVVKEGVKVGTPEQGAEDDANARALLCSLVSREYYSDLADCTSAQAIWEFLEKRHANQSCASILSILQSLSSLRKSPTETIQAYIGRAKELAARAAAASNKQSDVIMVNFITNGLPAEYEVYVTSCLATLAPIHPSIPSITRQTIA